jgi:uncharacterized protein DUF4386
MIVKKNCFHTAKYVGLLFITATFSSVIGTFCFLDPIINNPDYLILISENQILLILGVFIDSINTASVVAIAILLYPVFKKQNETYAVAYLSTRIIESVILIIGHISLLTLASQELLTKEASLVSSLLLSVYDLTFLIGPGIVFSITALILNIILYKSKLVPRIISVWGFLGAILLFAADIAAVFGLSISSTIFILLVIPIGLNEMVLAVWLIVKGFNPSAVNGGEK